MSKPTIAIIGPGNIGRDLVIKLCRSPNLSILGLIGRNYGTSSEEFAARSNVPYYGSGISEYLEYHANTNIFIDATTAECHAYHCSSLEHCNAYLIDLTPSGMGIIYSPIASPSLPIRGTSISLVSCGGQASLPLLASLGKYFSHLEYIEIVSSMASLAVGPATRSNIDEYIITTQNAINKLVSPDGVKVMLNINPANPPVNMKTTINLVGDTDYSLEELTSVARKVEASVREYCPGYSINIPPLFMSDGRLVTMVQIQGAGDYLPTYAGNIDIINSACVKLCEEIAYSCMI